MTECIRLGLPMTMLYKAVLSLSVQEEQPGGLKVAAQLRTTTFGPRASALAAEVEAAAPISATIRQISRATMAAMGRNVCQADHVTHLHDDEPGYDVVATCMTPNIDDEHVMTVSLSYDRHDI